MFLLLLLMHTVIAEEPEARMKTMELIRHYGYPGEAIDVVTEDGYILEMQRIPHGKQDDGKACRPVVLLQYGLLAETSSWIKMLPEDCLPLILADAGFDVWMGNVRGTTYGRRHKSLSVNDQAFWHFSWDDMSRYDLVAMVDKILEVTRQHSLYYIGHSQGTLLMFTRLADDPVFSKKIKKHFELAPAGSLKHIKGLTGAGARVFEKQLKRVFRAYGDRVLLPDQDWLAVPKRALCRRGSGLKLCAEFLFLLGGPRTDQFNDSRLPIMVEGLPAGTSAMNIYHWAQMILGDGKVRRFDYDSRAKNMEKYGQEIPPFYDYGKITTPTYLYWADEDYFATPEDVKAGVLSWLNHDYIVENNHMTGYNHFDFIIGMRAPKEIYRPIRDAINEDFDWKCAN